MTDPHNASAAMAGYLFQCRLALLLGLRRAKRFPGEWVSVETFDDVAFEDGETLTQLLQAKHHGAAKTIADGDTNLWKTLRIWINDLRSEMHVASDRRYVLITTGEAQAGSALALLRPSRSDADVEAARKRLTEAATIYTATASQAGRAAFLALTLEEASILLSQVDVIDRHPDLSDMRDEIEGELRILGPDHVEQIADDLEGWWFARIAERLVADRGAAVALQDIQRKASDIGAKYLEAGLPIADPATLGLPEYTKADEALTFVRQMRAVEFPDRGVQRGVRDFYRAKTQRSRWAREALLLDGETARYDANLVDRFERRYDEMADGITCRTEEEKAHFGRQMCHWACREEVQFRDVVETWITSGSFHALADRSRVGWHPDHAILFPRTEDDDE